MTIVTFVLAIILVAAGAGGLAASLNLLPTELGLLYAVCGVVLVCGGVVTSAIGVAILRLEALTRVVRFAAAVDDDVTEDVEPGPVASRLEREPTRQAETTAAEPGPAEAEDELAETAQEEAQVEVHAAEPPTASEEEAPVEETAVEDHGVAPPSVAELEQALAASQAEPTLVGHYSAGGANYKIFSDGSIEAETAGGAFRFASMAEFKSYLAGERA